MWDYGIQHIAIFIAVYYYCGFWLTLPALIALVYIFDYVISLFGYRRVGYSDITFLYFDEIINSNTLWFFEIDIQPFEKFRDTFYLRLSSRIPKFFEVPVNAFGTYFYKQVDKKRAYDNIIKDETKVNSEKELIEYLKSVANIKLKKYDLLYQIRYIEDYTESTSVFMFIVDHAFTDGLGFSAILSALDDDQFTKMKVTKSKSPDYIHKLWIYITSFFKLYQNYKKISSLSSVKLPEQKGFVFGAPVKHVSFSNFEFSSIRKCYKKYKGATLNDFMNGIIGKSLHEMWAQVGIKESKYSISMIPVTYKDGPANYDELIVDNRVTTAIIPMKLGEDLTDWISETLTHVELYKEKEVNNFTLDSNAFCFQYLPTPIGKNKSA